MVELIKKIHKLVEIIYIRYEKQEFYNISNEYHDYLINELVSNYATTSDFTYDNITKTLFITTEVQGSFMGVYQNNKHLREILIKLKTILKWI